ncbi:hypothetical protein PV797_13765 [Clostridiaceae bacterium M8S5]|nr:hypothetical protein PV797_13765 [Clostridiaceae bacterium M8S5]
MKKYISFIILISSMLFLIGCSNKKQEYLTQYITVDLKPIIDTQNEILDEYEKLTQNKSIEPETMLNALDKSIIPKSKNIIFSLEGIHSESAEITRIHKILVDGYKHQFRAFITFREGLSTDNTNVIYYAEKLLDEAKKHMSDFNNEVEKLKNLN